jgi:hypothetical protein
MEILDVFLGLLMGGLFGFLPASSPMLLLTVIGPGHFSPWFIVSAYAAYDLISISWMVNLVGLGDNPSLQGSMKRLLKQGNGASAVRLFAMWYYVIKTVILFGSIPLLLLGTRLFSALEKDVQVFGLIVFLVSLGLMIKRYGASALIGIVGACLIGLWMSGQENIYNVPAYIGLSMFGITSLVTEITSPSTKPIKQWLDVSGETHWSLAIACGFISSILWGINDSLMWELLNGDEGSDSNKVLAGAILKGTSSGLTLVMALQASGAKHELGEILGQSGYTYNPGLALALTILLGVLGAWGYSQMEYLMSIGERVGRMIGTKMLAFLSLIACITLLVVGVGPGAAALLILLGLFMRMTSGNANVALLVIASLPVIGLLRF